MLEIKTVKDAFFYVKTKLKTNDIQMPSLDAQLIVADAINTDRLGLFLNYDKPLTDIELSKINEKVDRRLKREPVAYILGKKEFCSHEFKVSPSVLVPRPETEYLVELIIDKLKNKISNEIDILDVGTGCSCIAIALALHFKNAKVVATDISEDVLTLAKENSDLHNVSNRIRFVKSDLFEDIDGQYDLIVSNPPYVSEDDKESLQVDILNYEPLNALFAPKEGFGTIEKLIMQAPNYLKPKGLLAIEIGDKHKEQALTIAKKTKQYDEIEVRNDLSGFDRYFFGKSA